MDDCTGNPCTCNEYAVPPGDIHQSPDNDPGYRIYLTERKQLKELPLERPYPYGYYLKIGDGPAIPLWKDPEPTPQPTTKDQLNTIADKLNRTYNELNDHAAYLDTELTALREHIVELREFQQDLKA